MKIINVTNKNKIILDLCGGTGSWSKPYSEAGYTVYNITLPHFDVFDVVCEKNIVTLNGENTLSIPASNIYGILAAPTCTMFSLARTNAKTPRDLQSAMLLVKKCLEIIWFCRAANNSKLKFWCLENPTGLLRQFLGRPALTFSPEEFGECYTKKTDLWGYFNVPKYSPHTLTEYEKIQSQTNTRILPQLPDDYVLPSGWNKQAARRSMTSSKFAIAFFKANQ